MMGRRRSLVAALGAALAGLAVAGPATAQPASEAERNRALVKGGFDAWRAGTGSPYDLLADNAEWTIVGRSVASRTYPSRAAFIGEVIGPFNARMRTPLVPVVRRLYAEGDTVIAFFDASGTTRNGDTYANTYAWFLEMRGGKIVRANAFFDSNIFDAFWRGVAPAPAN